MLLVMPRRPSSRPYTPARARTIGNQPLYVPPYSLPTDANTSVLIGSNSAQDVRPGTHSSGQWEVALLGAWGAGAMVNKGSTGGIYAISASGGHSDPSNVDLVYFDLADATWKRVANANGISNRAGAFTLAETTGTPNYEVSAASSGQFPSPWHYYGTAMGTDEGDLGSLLIVTRGAITNDTPSYNSPAVYRQDIATRLWTRVHNGAGGYANYEGSVALDDVAGRIYVAGPDIGAYQYMYYHRLSDNTPQVTPNYGWPSQPGADLGRLLCSPGTRELLFHRTGSLQRLDLTDDTTITSGWSTLSPSGTPPQSGNSWVYHPRFGAWYCKTSNSGNNLARLEKIGGTWTFSTITIGGAGLPNRTINSNGHQTALAYASRIDRFIWVYGLDQVAVVEVS